jgi:c-di-GMP-binding flagellar brake protein YcgR
MWVIAFAQIQNGGGRVRKESSVEYACRRLSTRFPVGSSDRPFVEFALKDGSPWQFSLLEISAMGIGFGIDEGHAAISVGMRIDRASIRTGGSRVEGSLRIVHVTPNLLGVATCGAEFRPLTTADEQTLLSLLGRLEDADQRTE